MKYLDKSFSVAPGGSKNYRDNYDAVFGKKPDRDDRPPHCDSLVLHAPGECGYCDRCAERQQDRIAKKINFTGHHKRGFKTCPAEKRRSVKTINRWPGNVPHRENP